MPSSLTPNQRFTRRNTFTTIAASATIAALTFVATTYSNRTRHATIALSMDEIVSPQVGTRLNQELGVTLSLRYGTEDLGTEARVYVVSLKNIGESSLVWKDHVPTDLVVNRPSESKVFVVTAEIPMTKRLGPLVPTVRRLDDGSFSVAGTHMNPNEGFVFMIIADSKDQPVVDFRPLSPINVVMAEPFNVNNPHSLRLLNIITLAILPTLMIASLVVENRIRSRRVFMRGVLSGALSGVYGGVITMIVMDLSLPKLPFILSGVAFIAANILYIGTRPYTGSTS